MSKQLELNLGDEFQQYETIAKHMYASLGSNSSIRIFNVSGELFLGIRTHFIETDYEYRHKISYEVAKHLLTLPYVSEFLDGVKKYEMAKTVTCKICGCVKTKEELKNTHKDCFKE